MDRLFIGSPHPFNLRVRGEGTHLDFGPNITGRGQGFVVFNLIIKIYNFTQNNFFWFCNMLISCFRSGEFFVKAEKPFI